MQDKAFFETKKHGAISFPYIVYRGDIPNYIHSFPLHWHDEMEIISITDGQGIVTVRSTRYEVSRGDIIVIPTQTVHAIDRYSDCRMQYFNILFSLSILDSIDDICHSKYFEPLHRHEISPVIYIENDTELNRLLAPHISELTENRHTFATDSELLIKSKLFALLHLLITHADDKLHEEKYFDTVNYDKLKKLLLYVREHYSERISIETAASICAYSCSHFMKIFKNMTGQSFTEYLVNYRLNAAANALALTSQSVIDIAYGCGFGNLSYFSRAFVQKYGITPSKYRAKFAKQKMRRNSSE